MTSPMSLSNLHYVDKDIKFNQLTWAGNSGAYRAALSLQDVFGRTDIAFVQVVMWSNLCWAQMDGSNITLIANQSIASSTNKITVRGFF